MIIFVLNRPTRPTSAILYISNTFKRYGTLLELNIFEAHVLSTYLNYFVCKLM